MSIKEIEVKDFNLRGLQVQMATLQNSSKHLKTAITTPEKYHKNSSKMLRRRENFLSYFVQVTSSHADTTTQKKTSQKKKTIKQYPYDSKCKNPQQNKIRSNPAMYKSDKTSRSNGHISRI